MQSDQEEHEKKKNRRARANPISAATFSWTLPVFWQGFKRDLLVDDLAEPLKEHNSSKLGNKLEKAWDEEVARCKGTKKEPNLKMVIFRVFGAKLLLYGLVIAMSELGARIAQPLLLGRLIEYFSPGSNMNLNEAYMSAAGVILFTGFTILITHPYMMAIMHIGMKLRVATCSLMYRKSLRLSKMSTGQTTVGQVVNLMSNDVNRFDIAFLFMHMLWIGPVQTVIITILMWRLFGAAALAGLASLLLVIPFQGWLGKRASMLRLKTALRTDERVRLMNEIISGIQVIKMYTWEKPFADLVAEARQKEIRFIKKSSWIRGIMLSFILFHTRASIFCTVLTYALMGNQITAEKVFVLASFYNILRQTMTVFFPQGITQIAEGLISVRRIKKYLLLDEIQSDRLPSSEDKKIIDDKLNGTPEKQINGTPFTEKYEHILTGFDQPGIEMKNASAKWTPEMLTLNNISLQMIPGKLTVVIGPVGAGKSSLLQALLKELELISGTIKICGKLSYASQEAWLFHASVRQNILFGAPFNKERYKKVIKVCALKTDFELLPYGDKTIVGERGVSLSGGQRARINLARAIYKEADVYLLDDPLSAVDTHVGKHLFEDCIEGYLKSKTVVLVTHQLQYLERVDQIVLLENGNLKAKGTYVELQNSGLDFTSVMREDDNREKLEADLLAEGNRRLASRQSSVQSVASSLFEENKLEPPQEIGETQAKGSVGCAVYGAYLKSGGGWWLVTLTLFMFFFSQLLASGGDYWVTYWVNLEEHYFPFNNSTEAAAAAEAHNMPEINYPFVVGRNVCIYIFSALITSTIIVTLFRSYLFFRMCMTSSMTLHNNMFNALTRTTMWFFNNNSSGRILNRFSKDMGAIDELLPSALIDVLQIGLTLLGIIVVIASINPWLLIPTAACAVIFYFLRIFYLSTSRSIKRLEGITRSPVFAHLNASIQGLSTIRAFGAQKILTKEFDNHQDLHSSAWYLFIASSRAFGFWLDLVCLVFIGLVTMSFLVLGGGSLGGNVGLAISQSIGLTGMFQWGMRQSAELENQMTSVERVLEYSKLEKEPPLESPPDKKPRKTWPEKGEIEFKDVHLRYSPTEPWVLKNLNFVIKPEEKIGIVGRTGAGKSSLIAALFRLSEIDGEILIDGVNASSIGLHELRSKISIIPQEPVLFSGTLRKNLDPFDEYNDQVLWSALDEVELRDVVQELTGGLQGRISEGGSNLSVGQRQLICLARAIVKNNKILVLDEATANVDPKTDILIQETIRKKFKNCTVLTIAHRLNTVMDSTKVLVMDAGTMVEFDHPFVLLKNPHGFLTKMVEQTGKVNTDRLLKLASESFSSMQLTGRFREA